ncbi:glutamate--tRNA ligase [Buchnera aphidicola]|uniref:glutamate--tRNA ligase n=1 Tax=Buchnera aphidicola TaxID=9 RepID=UPI0031B7383B
MKIKTRFSPSPTGFLHLGGLRTALFSWLFARKNNGSFILRIEDTDKKRFNENSSNDIMESLSWLGLFWDEGPIYQSSRLKIYQKAILKLLNLKRAYKCYCSYERLELLRSNLLLKGEKPRYDGKCRFKENQKKNNNKSFVIRFKNPKKGSVKFLDQILGEIIVQNSELDDVIIQRSDGMPTYNFCVVVDDIDMKITHVIRGNDHLNNTPRQINLFNALDGKVPKFAHLSMVLDFEGKKISKRYSQSSILKYRMSGYLPETILNYLFSLGTLKNKKEIYSLKEMKSCFSFKKINKSPNIVNKKKILWFNHYYLKTLNNEKIFIYFQKYLLLNKIKLVKSFPTKELIFNFIKRHVTLEDFLKSYTYFYQDVKFSSLKNLHIGFKIKDILILIYFKKKILNLKKWSLDNLSEVFQNILCKFNLKFSELAPLIRLSVTGCLCTPSLKLIIFYLGKKCILIRLKSAIQYFKKNILNNKYI